MRLVCRCGRKAVTYLRHYRLALCNECYVEFYRRMVSRSIKKYGIFRKGERILAAVSGGKDSSAMASILVDLGYDVDLLFIDLGIPGYSERSEKVVRELAETLEVELHVVRLSEYGFTLRDVRRRKICSACGTSKRYIMNRFARENGYDIVSTGHTAEDIATFFIKNTAGGNAVYADKLLPRNDPFDEKLVARGKPLFEVYEKENMIYVLVSSTPFTSEECPYAPKPEWKEIIYEIEGKKPGFIKNFVRGLVKRGDSEWEVKHCARCGEVSSTEICAFCRLKERVVRRNS